MWYRPLAHLLAGSALCATLGACCIDRDELPVATFSIGGTVQGATGPLALQNSNGTNVIVAMDGSFRFETPMVSSALYNVTVAVPPNSQACSVRNGSGTVRNADISNVSVTCEPISYLLSRR